MPRPKRDSLQALQEAKHEGKEEEFRSKVLEEDKRTPFQKEKDQERLEVAAFRTTMEQACQAIKKIREARRAAGEPTPRIPE